MLGDSFTLSPVILLGKASTTVMLGQDNQRMASFDRKRFHSMAKKKKEKR